MIEINNLLQTLKQKYQDFYQDQLEQIILFGSQARQHQRNPPHP